MQRNTKRSILAAIGMLALASSSQAAIMLDDHFEYDDQAAFAASWSTTGSSVHGTLSTTQAKSPTHSINFPTTAGSRSEKALPEVVATDIAPLEFRFQFYDTNGTAAAYRQYGELLDGTGTGNAGIIAMGLNNNLTSNFYMARITALDGDGAGPAAASGFFRLDGDPAKTRSTGWHELKAMIYPASVEFYVDGGLTNTVALPAGFQSKSYDRVRIGSNISATQQAFFDDVFYQQVPEPASLSLLGLGAAAALGRRRRA